MKILLANYNYFPFRSGGSEVYVSGLAKYLIAEGHEVRIVASVPVGFRNENLDYSGRRVQISFYLHDGISIAGAWLSEEPVEQIYGMFNQDHVNDWEDFFRSNADWIPDAIHLHGYTGTINTAMVVGLRSISSEIPFYFSYHTPVSCPKGTLFRFNLEECTVKPSISNCTACVIHNKIGGSPFLSRLIGKLLPNISSKLFPNSIRIKHLISLNLLAFEQLKKLTDHFFLFSDYIRSVLIINNISQDKMTMIRHGVDHRFLVPTALGLKPNKPLYFVFMGRLEKIKGIVTLIKAWEKLDVSEDRKLRMIGMVKPETDPEIKDAIQLLAKRSDVQIESVLSRENLIQKLDDSHVIIIPSEWIEIGPLVFHEAIARGLHVIASDIGGTRELSEFYGAGCTIFETGNATSLKNAMEKFSFFPLVHQVQSEREHYQAVSKKIYREKLK